MIPHVTWTTDEICLHESFLSYVWALSYAFLVIFDEQIHGPGVTKVPERGLPLGHFVERAYGVLRYGLGLRTDFEPWPQSLPNPENYGDEDEFYVLRANAIYLAAVDFILCHELAHIACSHSKKLMDVKRRDDYISSVREFEQEADQWAFTCVLKGIGGERTPTTVGFGAITALGALLFLQQSLTSRTHPDTDDRILSVLERLSLDDKDNLWGAATAFFLAWNAGSSNDIELPTEGDTYKELFFSVRSALASLKIP